MIDVVVSNGHHRVTALRREVGERMAILEDAVKHFPRRDPTRSTNRALNQKCKDNATRGLAAMCPIDEWPAQEKLRKQMISALDQQNFPDKYWDPSTYKCVEFETAKREAVELAKTETWLEGEHFVGRKVKK